MPSAVSGKPQGLRGTSWTTRLVLLGIVALTVGVLGLTGGLDRAAEPPARVATVAVNQSVDAGPFSVTVTNAAATDDLAPFKPRTEGNWLLAVAVRLEVTTPEAQPASRFLQTVTLPGLKGLVNPDPRFIVLIRDASELAFVNPGLPERVAFIFEVAKAVPVPKQIEVVLNGQTADWDWIQRSYYWSYPLAERARITVDVANKVGAS